MNKTRIEYADYHRGYLAGMTNGDGTFKMPVPGRRYRNSQWYWRVALRDEFILKRLRQVLRKIGIRIPIREFSVPGMVKLETRRAALLKKIYDAIYSKPITASYELGYLAGIFDAEGNWHKSNLRIYNSKEEIRNRVMRYGYDLGFLFYNEDYPSEKSNGVRLVGDRYEAIRFLASIRSAKSKNYLRATNR